MDPASTQDWARGAAALKSTFDALASAWKMVKEFRSTGNNVSPEEAALVDRALDEAASASKLAQAQIAKALGYQLCHCTFPPTAMLTVGSTVDWKAAQMTVPVYECPRCGYNSVGREDYDRIAPTRPPSVVKAAPTG
jgi:hypothetical protein